MSQRNPMNERYTSDDRRGTTRKSAASAKPKSKAASSVTVVPGGKKPKTKEQIKAEQREEDRKRREFNNRYYKPDTLRYKRLRIAWWVCLVLAIGCCALAFMGQDFLSGRRAWWCLCSPTCSSSPPSSSTCGRCARSATPTRKRMRQVELKREKAERAAAQQSQQKKGTAKKGSGKNQNRHAAQKAAPAAEEAPASDETPAKPARRGLFGSGFRLSNREKMQAEKKAAKEAKAAAKKESAE